MGGWEKGGRKGREDMISNIQLLYAINYDTGLYRGRTRYMYRGIYVGL